MWWTAILSLISAFIYMALKSKQPHRAAGAIAFASLCFPSWLILPLFRSSDTIVGTGIEVVFLVGSVMLGLYLFLPGRRVPLLLTPCDLCVAALIVLHLICDQSHTGLGMYDLGRAYVEWYMPYILGRVAIQSRQDMEKLLPVVACISMFLACIAMFEATFRLNLIESVFGNRPLEGFPRDASRWGMKRAYGPCLHPIYFGGVQLLLFPWALLVASRALQKRAHAIWILAPLIGLLGIGATGSRGPLLAAGLLVLGLTFGLQPRWRIPLAIVGFLGAALVWLNGDAILQSLEAWSGEQSRRRPKVVVVEDEDRELTGTSSRVLLMDVYRIAMRKSGWLGFGSEAVSSFPVNVPVGPQEVATLQELRNIDNTYVLMTLRFGYLGLVTFGLVLLTGIGQAAWIGTRYSGSSVAFLAFAIASTITAFAFLIFTVWLPPDMAIPFMMTIGISSGLTYTHFAQRLRTVREADSEFEADEE